MKAKLVQIGNSKGIRIPKVVLEQCKLKGEVELEINDETLIIHPCHKKRKNWNLLFKKITENKTENKDDALLDPTIDTQLTTWEQKEWQWK